MNLILFKTQSSWKNPYGIFPAALCLADENGRGVSILEADPYGHLHYRY